MMTYSWSITSFFVFRPNPPGADPWRGQNRSLGPFLPNRKATAKNRTHSNDLDACRKKCCCIFSFRCQILTSFDLLNAFSIDFL